MTDMSARAPLAGPAIMLLSAAIFGYFGFTMKPVAADGTFVLFMAILTWTLRVSAILFAACAGVALVSPIAGNLLYALVGVVGAGLFVVVAIMDVADRNYATIHPLLLLIFAAWNGFGSWSSLSAVLGAGRAPRADTSSGVA